MKRSTIENEVVLKALVGLKIRFFDTVNKFLNENFSLKFSSLFLNKISQKFVDFDQNNNNNNDSNNENKV